MLPINFQQTQAITQARGLWNLPQWWTDDEVQQFLSYSEDETIH